MSNGKFVQLSHWQCKTWGNNWSKFDIIILSPFHTWNVKYKVSSNYIYCTRRFVSDAMRVSLRLYLEGQKINVVVSL